MKKWLLLGVTLVYLLSCGRSSEPPSIQAAAQTASDDESAETEELIIGGHLVTKKEEIASTTVSLLDTRQGTLCTASILSEEVAITAAHCVDGDPNDMQLSFGPRSAGREVRPLVEVAVSTKWRAHQHDQFNNGDIALVKFSGGLPETYKTASVMKSSHHLMNGEIVTLAGYGITNGNGDGAGRLRSVDVKIADARYSLTEVTLDQTKRRGACHGDSGGPAFIQNNNGGLLLWGVTSRGINDPTDHCIGQSVYTRVQPYTRWINTVVRRWQK